MTSLPAGVTVEVTQLRGDIAPGRMQVRLENASEAAVSFGRLTLSSPVLAAGTETAKDDVALAAGRAVNLPVTLPALVCGDTGAPVVSGVYDAGSGPVAFAVAAADPLDVLSRLGARQCDVDRIAAVADIRAAGVTPRADGVAVLDLAVQPAAAGDGMLRLVAVRGTPLLRFAQGEEAPLDVRVAAGDAASVVPVEVVPRRCDPHALAEDKVGTLFTLVVELDGETLEVPLPRSQEVADALVEFVGAACGLAG